MIKKANVACNYFIKMKIPRYQCNKIAAAYVNASLSKIIYPKKCMIQNYSNIDRR
jgi:hypothetical protein